MTAHRPAARLGLDPPLDPSGDEARSALRRELAHPDYHETNLVERILTWIGRKLDEGVGAAADVPPLTTFAGMLVGLLLLAAVVWLVSRARLTARTKAERTPALTDERVTAGELRARAEASLQEGRYDDALVDGFRALAVRQVEHGRIEDTPQATAHELARALAAEFPTRRHLVDRAADLFDFVLYGEHPATREQAVDVLDLDQQLAGRPTRSSR